MTADGVRVSPELFLETVTSYQRTAAIKAAIELNVFTAIASGATVAAGIARACEASERGVRMLCDFLTVIGLITKNGGHYGLPDSAAFLDRRSPAYLGGLTPHARRNPCRGRVHFDRVDRDARERRLRGRVRAPGPHAPARRRRNSAAAAGPATDDTVGSRYA